MELVGGAKHSADASMVLGRALAAQSSTIYCHAPSCSIQRTSTIRCFEPEELEQEIELEKKKPFSVRSLPGVTEPLGFFDPWGLSENKSEGEILFYREAELKHGRVAMLAALGFPIGEMYHPLYGGEIDVPSYVAFQETPLQAFWPLLFFVIGPFELYSVFSLKEPFTIRADYESGDLGFDPLGLKPEDEEEFREMQTKELNNGRLAMIAIAGQVIQELVTQQKLFEDYPPVVDGGLTTIIEGSAPLYE